MKLGVLFSGGKDSTLALHLAKKYSHEIVCLISIISKNPESYMFHTPNINLTEIQAKALNIPIIMQETEGQKETELEELTFAIKKAKAIHNIQGIITGAVGSTYQASRVQSICSDLDLWCINPLWQKDQIELIHDLIKLNFKIKIIGIYGYPLDDTWLNTEIDKTFLKKIIPLYKKYGINPAGEGGEIETLAIDSPDFKKEIKIKEYTINYNNHAGDMNITNVELIDKK